MSFPNPEQAAVIARREGSLLVLAPAGTGKTRVMAERLARAIEDGVDPRRVLCLTFTNRAASEMRGRVRDRLGAGSRAVRLSTFHGLCAWMLRLEAEALGLARDFVIYDEQDSDELLAAILRDERVAYDAAAVRNLREELWRAKSDAPPGNLRRGLPPPLATLHGEPGAQRAVERYHAALGERHVLDFGDLIYHTRCMLHLLADRARAWRQRFDWIQVDEVQDTHFSEYDVLRLLGRGSHAVAFFGDVDQTIYEWRGSDPQAVIEAFERDFAPVRRMELSNNYRATRRLLELADRFAGSFARRRTRLCAAPGLPEGTAPEMHQAESARDEGDWIAGRIERLRVEDGHARVGVLARTHRRTAAISEALSRRAIDHVTVEQFAFFRRQEIKDALARTRLLLNPSDGGAMHRLLLRPASGVGAATLARVRELGGPAGLRLVDLGREETHRSGEPFGALIEAWRDGRVVVLDVESTGLSTAGDEVVEIAALRVGADGPAETFHRYVRPSRPVGESVEIHGLTDELLAREGRDGASVFGELGSFVADAHVVGHNLRFDLSILRAHGIRCGVELPRRPWDDTLDLARRLVRSESYDLTTLCGELDVETVPTHRALDDTRATAGLLAGLMRRVVEGAAGRAAVVRSHGAAFRPVAAQLDSWRRQAERVRPAALLSALLEESGLRDLYAAEPRRSAHLDELVAFFDREDDPSIDPLTALDAATRTAALARNVDHLAADDPRIPVLTVHQAKGLEFDAVFVAGVCEGEFPSFYAEREGRTEEERRLFYVALTRPRRAIFVSCHRADDRGRSRRPSPFLRQAGLV